VAQLEDAPHLAGEYVHSPQTLPLPRSSTYSLTWKEERDAGAINSWVGVPMTKILIEFEQSLEKYPPMKAGTPDPYIPPK